jgi:hypothetical protein
MNLISCRESSAKETNAIAPEIAALIKESNSIGSNPLPLVTARKIWTGVNRFGQPTLLQCDPTGEVNGIALNLRDIPALIAWLRSIDGEETDVLEPILGGAA